MRNLITSSNHFIHTQVILQTVSSTVLLE